MMKIVRHDAIGKRRRVAQVVRRQRCRSRGKCRCGREKATGRSLCQPCLQSARTCQARRRLTGCRHGEGGQSTCQKCLLSFRVYWATRRSKLNWAGLRFRRWQNQEAFQGNSPQNEHGNLTEQERA